MSKKIIGVDIGATKIHLGVVENSRVIEEKKVATVAAASKEVIVQDLIKGIESLNSKDFDAIGIGVPGLVDEKEGIVYDLFNIPSWKEVNLKELLQDHFQKPVRITNDANVFALGEKVFGFGMPYANMVGVTLGTGFGTGIIANNKLYSGNLSSAGEVGSVDYLDATIEDYCSAKFFSRKGVDDGAKIYAKAEIGDKVALEIMEEYGLHLGKALVLIMKVLSPEAILLGGSISESYPFFKKSLETTLTSFPFDRVLQKVVIRPSNTKNIAILGAAALIVSEDLEEGIQDQNLNQYYL